MNTLKNNFKDSKEKNRELIGVITSALLILTTILLLYSSFNKNANSRTTRDSDIATEYINDVAHENSMLDGEMVPNIQQ